MNKLNGQVDGFEDLLEFLRKPAKAHGREMVALVYGAGLASVATEQLARVLGRSPEGLQGLRLLAGNFNEMSSAYAKAMGWTEAVLAQCDRDIQLSYAGTLQVAAGARIILEH